MESNRVETTLEEANEIFTKQPFTRFIGARLTEFSKRGVEIRLEIREQLCQQDGFVHGGVLAYLADNVLTFAGGATLSGQIVTSELKLNYLRPAVGNELVARGISLSTGRTQSVARCEIFVVKDGIEHMCAAGQGTVVSLVHRG